MSESDNADEQHDNNATPNGEHRLVKYQFKPGQSGNPKGRPPKGTRITDEIRKLVDQGLNDKDVAAAIAKKIIEQALRGNVKFVQIVLERMEGKVPDELQVDDLRELNVRFAKLSEVQEALRERSGSKSDS